MKEIKVIAVRENRRRTVTKRSGSNRDSLNFSSLKTSKNRKTGRIKCRF